VLLDYDTSLVFKHIAVNMLHYKVITVNNITYAPIVDDKAKTIHQ